MDSMNINEGFKGNLMKTIDDQKLIIKSVIFGLLFYLLANPRSFKYTNFIGGGLDKILTHSIIFVIIIYLIEKSYQ